MIDLKSRGFTLLELMIVVAIIAVIAVVAVPQYERYVDNARRTDAQAALLSFASQLERRFTETNSYCDNGTTDPGTCGEAGAGNGDLGAPAADFFPDRVPLDGVAAATYNLEFVAVTDTTYTIQATRVGIMADDDDCGDFQLTQTGLKDQINNNDDCW